jgi:hypothetical protein
MGFGHAYVGGCFNIPERGTEEGKSDVVDRTDNIVVQGIAISIHKLHSATRTTPVPILHYMFNTAQDKMTKQAIQPHLVYNDYL